MDVANILIIGNGFDLYHGLPTRYTDFLTLIKNWGEFYEYMPSIPTAYRSGEALDYKYSKINLAHNLLTSEDIKELSKIDPIHYKWDNIEQLNREINKNLWIKYFVEKEYEKENWIDFEKEVEKVVLKVKDFYDRLPSLYDKKIEGCFDKETQSIIEIFSGDNNGFPTDKNRALVLDDIESSRVEELKQNVIKTMKNHLDKLIDCLRIYFIEFVDKINFSKKASVISEIVNPYVLNFNYTNYISTYDVSEDSVHYIHGNIYNPSDLNNMVLGINDEKVQDNDFVYFFKYFQRIQKRTGNQYKHWSPEPDGYGGRLPLNVYVFGHSLDSNDKSILSDFFKRSDVSKIVIYHHNQKAFENQVINLIDMFGKDFVIDNVSNQRIQFVPIQERGDNDDTPSLNEEDLKPGDTPYNIV